MPKFFVVSDVHGFYDELVDALHEAGFDRNNPNHWVYGLWRTFLDVYFASR